LPIATIAGLVVVTAALLVLILFADPSRASSLEGTLIAVIPALIAAGYSERTSRDVRNGVVEAKAQAGAAAALQASGVTDAVSSAQAHSQSYVTALDTHTAALQELLARVAASDAAGVQHPDGGAR
jgi:hypothetical protein